MQDLGLTILRMLNSLLPVILAGISVMIWMKLPVLRSLARPIDGGRNLGDGRRLFGDHKTWKGFLGYILLGSVWTAVWGLVSARVPALEANNFLYAFRDNTPAYNLVMGAALGFAYALFELPNSFVKRRLDIQEGGRGYGLPGALFVFIDQADSVVGCVLVLAFVYPMTAGFALLYILVGASVHLFLNALLFAAGLRQRKR